VESDRANCALVLSARMNEQFVEWLPPEVDNISCHVPAKSTDWVYVQGYAQVPLGSMTRFTFPGN
jgi:hypothetical protein